MQRKLVWSLVLPFLISLAGCGGSASTGNSSDSSGSASLATSAPQQLVGVSNLTMTLNGSPWLSRGVALQAFVRPLAALQANPAQAAVLRARQNYGADELAAIQAFHADTIRFQIGQPALDPASPLYDPGSIGEVVSAITQARQAGFVVMLMMQDEAISGEPQSHPLPIAQTASDWDLLAARFGNDRGVVFELYNEPNLAATPANWQLWLQGGTVPGQSIASIGMQTLVTRLRTAGAQNVFVLDGLDLGKTLNGLPAVSDPLNRLVYAVHPYQKGSADESQWDDQFGIPSTQVPVWVDEWSAPTGLNLGLAGLTDYQVAVDLINYLRAHSIPLCTGAFDVPRFVVQDVPGWTPTNYDDIAQKSQIDGSGMLVFTAFATNYSRALTLADGLSH